MKLLIAGSREVDIDQAWNAINLAASILDEEIEFIIEGGARGVDSIANDWALQYAHGIKTMYADWDGPAKKGAGIVRNRQMVTLATHAIIVWDGESKGTRHTLGLVQQKGIPYVLVRL